MIWACVSWLGENLRKYRFSLDAVIKWRKILWLDILIFISKAVGLKLYLVKRQQQSLISLKKMFGHFFCAWDNVLGFLSVLKHDYRMILCLEPLWSQSGLLWGWSSVKLFMFHRLHQGLAESATRASARWVSSCQGLLSSLSLCTGNPEMKKAIPVLKELPQCVHVVIEVLKVISTNYYLACIQVLFQIYCKGTISPRIFVERIPSAQVRFFFLSVERKCV